MQPASSPAPRRLAAALLGHARLPFLSRRRALGPEQLSDPDLGLRYLPLVGAVVAGLQLPVFAIVLLVLPRELAVLAVVLAGLLLSGSLGERGLGRWCDALAGSPARSGFPALAGNGSVAAVAIVMAILIRLETLMWLDPQWVGAALLCGAVVSRALAVLVAASLAPGKLAQDAAVALVTAGIPLALLLAWTAEPLIVAIPTALAIVASAWVRRLIRRRQGRPDGHGLWAVQQLGEAAFLLGMVLMVGGPVESAESLEALESLDGDEDPDEAQE